MSLLEERYSAAEIHELAERLDGRPIPDLRVSEVEFEAMLDEDVRAEWVDGEVIIMAPVGDEHSELNLWLLRLVAEVVEHFDAGAVRGPELQVRFAARRRRRTPDLLFVSKSRLKILRPTHIEGPPDLIMEVVSPESESRDWRDKYLDYEAAGVKEYWIIDPCSQRVEAYALERGRKYRRLDEVKGQIKSKVVRGLIIRPTWLWRRPLPKLREALREIGTRS